MLTLKSGCRRIIGLVLTIAIFISIFPINTSASVVSLKTLAENCERVERLSIINSGNELCTWTPSTQISNVTALYDPYGSVNGYIFEYVNGEEKVGFMQIDIIAGEAYPRRYGFIGEHYATEQLRKSRTNQKIVFTGDFEYYAVSSFDENSVAYHLGKAKIVDAEYARAVSEYDSYITEAIERKKAILTSNQIDVLSSRATVKTVSGFQQYLTLATYNNTGDSGNGCTILSALSCCKYWSECRGKSGIYSSIPGTYRAIQEYIVVDGAGGVSNASIAYNGYRNYLRANGFTITTQGTITYNEWNIAKIAEIIDMNIPFTMAQAVDGGVHAITVFGYDIQSSYKLLIGDAYSTVAYYEYLGGVNGLAHTQAANQYSYYVG